MASRFHQRDARSALFSSYDAQVQARPDSAASTQSPRSSSRNAAYSTNNPNVGSPYGLTPYGNSSQTQSNNDASLNASFNAYPGANGVDSVRRDGEGFRPATPNKKGQYSSAVLDELESQNEDQVSEMSKRVKMLKDITSAIGVEIRDSTAFAEKMNDQFEGTRNRLRGTMNRMLLMAERTGIGWRIWLGFFAFLILLFFYVWLF